MDNLFSVKNDTVLITGASSGLGKYCTCTLAKHGANVILVGRDRKRLTEVEKKCREHGIKTLSIIADIKNASDVFRIIEQSKRQFDVINILINMAGVGMRVSPLDVTEKQWNSVIDVNLKGTFLVMKAVSKWMMETKTSGKIINVSSSSAFHTTETRVAYSASKLAVESITRNFALYLIKYNIRVNCIAPGYFNTPLTEAYLQSKTGKIELSNVPMKRAADITEMEGVLLLLSSNASSYMTGSVVHIDGGYAIQKT